ncbi:SFCGS family glycine-rich protein [Streptomyces sp. NRRL F-5053]|uniref:SFCGS family glycine-rich protein n=1 Tax=Streptomyces sp. NRRL F-5053 TaxID=1463854 RepID=UPI0007C4DC65|nr:SFCGS family glycine-rich protein [Streptomyces sp. NRRL F-5053]
MSEATAVKIVIGHRLGKGQSVADGVRAAGAEPVLIPGPGADMKVGDVMQAEGAALGISFCGSGGAGAVTAKAKYGHDIEFGMRSAQAGVTAVQQGRTVLGFGFLDSEELGYAVATALLAKLGTGGSGTGTGGSGDGAGSARTGESA